MEKREELAGIGIEQQRLELEVKEHLARQRLRVEKAEILGGKILELCVEVGGVLTGDVFIGGQPVSQRIKRVKQKFPARRTSGIEYSMPLERSP